MSTEHCSSFQTELNSCTSYLSLSASMTWRESLGRAWQMRRSCKIGDHVSQHDVTSDVLLEQISAFGTPDVRVGRELDLYQQQHLGLFTTMNHMKQRVSSMPRAQKVGIASSLHAPHAVPNIVRRELENISRNILDKKENRKIKKGGPKL